MKRIILTVMMVIALALSGCTGNTAEELFETGQFEELQNNQAHAKQLYQEILERYPTSEYAAKARERLSALQDEK
jgi:TolA-binding protein